jgi:hypothetical protein
MSQFYIINESTEDTLEATDNLQHAIRVAREVAGHGQTGDPVSILDGEGLAVRQFVRMPDGTVAEQAVARPVKALGDASERNWPEPGTPADRQRDNRPIAS